MMKEKLKQPQALLAGICMLLSTLLWHICSSLPMGRINLVNTFRYIFEADGDVGGCIDSVLWMLIFFAFIFAAIALFKGDPKLSAIALFVLGGLFLADDILILALWFSPRTLLELVPHVTIILAAVTVLKRNASLRNVAAIAAAAGFVADLVFRLVVLHMQLTDDFFYTTEAQYIGRTVIVIFANLFIMMGLILACLAVDYGVRPAARGASFTPNTRQPQQPYAGQQYGSPYAGRPQQPQQPYGGQWQQPSPYAGQAQPSAQPSPFAGQAQQPFAGQGQSPFAGQGQSPFAGQPQQPYAGQAQQPFAGQGQSPFAGQGQSPFAGQPQQPFSGQPQQPDPDLEDKTQILPDDDFPETDPTVIL